MKPSLMQLLDYAPEELAENLRALAQHDLSAAFDSAVILSKNLHPEGRRMPLVIDFITAQFERINISHSAHGAEFNALAAVGDFKHAQPDQHKKAAELFASKIQGVAFVDQQKAKNIALNIKAFTYERNPVRKEAVKFLIEVLDYEGLEDLARHAHHFSDDEKMIFLEKVESFAQDKPNAVKRLMDGYINRAGYSMSAAGRKAEKIFEYCEKAAGAEFAVLRANHNELTYLGDGDNPDISVPLDRTLN